MRIAIAAISSQYIHMPLTPFVLQRAIFDNCPGAETDICDVNINDTPESITQRILRSRPQAVCFAVYIWNREMTAKIAARIRAVFPETLIIMGGPEVTYSVEETFAEMQVDFIIRGAGEEALPRLLMQLENGGSTAGINGVCSRCSHTDAVAEAAVPRDDIYDSCWQNMLQGRMAYVETSRGCPFSCAFCLSGKREPVVFMNNDKALNLLIRLGNSGTDTVKIIDRTFNCSHSRTKYLLQGLIDAKKQGEIGNVCYHTEVAADLFDEEELSILSGAPVGLFQMEAGLQSFHRETLERCSRSTDMERLQDRIIRIVQMGNVHLHIDLIAGLPKEDMATFAESFNRAYNLMPNQLQLGFLKLIYGSRLRESDWQQRFDPNPPYEVLSTPWMSYFQLQGLHMCAEAVEKIYNSGRFSLTLEKIFRECSITPFRLFMELGEKIAAHQGKISSEGITEIMLDECIALGMARSEAADALTEDRLMSDASDHLPKCLSQPQEKYEAAKRAAREYRRSHPEKTSVRFASLGNGEIILADWTEKSPVTLRGSVIHVPVK